MRVILGSLLLLVVTGLMFNKLCFNMVSDKKTQRFLLSLLISGILLKMLVFFSWYGHAGGIEFNPSLADQYAYISDGQSIAEGLESGKFIYYDEMRSRVGYSYFVGIILLIFGRHLFFLSLCNIFFTVIASCYIFNLTCKYYQAGTASIVFALMLFFPQFISASFFLLKDSIVIFLTVFSFWAYLTIQRKVSRLLLVLAGLSTMALFRLPQAMGIFSIMVAGEFIVNVSLERKHKIIYFLLFLGAYFIFWIALRSVGVSVSKIGFSLFLFGDHGYVRITFDPIETAIVLYRGIMVAPGTFLRSFITDLIRALYGPFYLYSRTGPVLTPYYFTETPFRSVLETLSGVSIGVLMPMVLLGGHDIVKHRRHRFAVVLIFVSVMFLLLPLTGNIFRWRLPFIPFLLFLASIGFSRIHEFKGFYLLYCMMYVLFIGLNATNLAILTFLVQAFCLYFGGWFLLSFFKKKMPHKNR